MTTMIRRTREKVEEKAHYKASFWKLPLFQGEGSTSIIPLQTLREDIIESLKMN